MHVAGLTGAIRGMAGRQWVQTLSPTSGLTLWSHDGEKHFEILGQKDIPGVPGKWVSFHSNLETFVSQLAKQEPPDSKVPTISRHWGAVLPGKWSST